MADVLQTSVPPREHLPRYLLYQTNRMFYVLIRDDVGAGYPISMFIIIHKHHRFNMIREFLNRHQSAAFRNESYHSALQLGFAPRTLRGLVGGSGGVCFITPPENKRPHSSWGPKLIIKDRRGNTSDRKSWRGDLNSYKLLYKSSAIPFCYANKLGCLR